MVVLMGLTIKKSNNFSGGLDSLVCFDGFDHKLLFFRSFFHIAFRAGAMGNVTAGLFCKVLLNSPCLILRVYLICRG